MEEYIDLVIPRGGEELIRAVVAHSKVPVIKHYKGVCHVYVDSDAPLEMAERICITLKCSALRCATPWKHFSSMKSVAPNFLPP